MRAVVFTLPAALALSACIEVDVAIEVLGEDEARVTGYMQMERAMFEMAGADASFCEEEEGGTLTLTDMHARCDFDQTGSFDEIMSADSDEEVPVDLQGQLESLGDGRVRAFMPLTGMTDDMDEMMDDPAMMAMMRQMMSGMSVTFTVKGSEIESSTGTISEDGTSATVSFGVDDLFAPADERPVDFETILRY